MRPDDALIRTENLYHEAERISQFELFEIIVDGRRRIKCQLQRGATRVGVLRQALSVRLLVFRGQSDQRARITKRRGVKARALIEDPAFADVGRQTLMRFGNCIPGSAIDLLPIGIGGN